jgi:hypothetical protein
MALSIRCNLQSSTPAYQGEFTYEKTYDIIDENGDVQEIDGIIVQLIEKKTAFRSKRDDSDYTTTEAIADYTGGCVQHMCRTYLEIFEIIDGKSTDADSFSNGSLTIYKPQQEIDALYTAAGRGVALRPTLEDLDDDEELEELEAMATVDEDLPDNSEEDDAYDEDGTELDSTTASIECGLQPLTIEPPMKRWEEPYLTKGVIIQTGRNVFISDPDAIAEIKQMATWKKSINSAAHGLPYTYDVSIADEIFAKGETDEVLHTVTVKWGYYNNLSLITSTYEPEMEGGRRRRRGGSRKTRRGRRNGRKTRRA